MNNSEIITAFLNIMDCKKTYQVNYDNVNEQDKLTQDLLHKIELDYVSYEERCKYATQLKTNRKDRRYYKDIVEELQPIYDFINDEQNNKFLNKLQKVLGEVRKQEEYHKNRTYFPRVLKEGKDDK